MAIFNVSFLNPKMRKKTGGVSGAKIISNRLAILEASLLGEENNLSPAEIDTLIDEHRKAQNSGVLTPTQISDYNVKIARYQQKKEAMEFSIDGNIDKINRDTENSDIEINNMLGNSPINYIKAKIASSNDKLKRLYGLVDRREREGMDFSEHLGELERTKRELESQHGSLQQLETFSGEYPIKGLVAYMNTNENGEMISVEYLPYGSKSGYAETDGMYDGCQIYGKINYKDQGYNHFLLGNIKFTEVDTMEFDPENPGKMKTKKLISDTRTRSGYKIGKHGWLNIPSVIEEDGKFYNTTGIQNDFPRNSWAKGMSGNIYKREEDGSSKKYINLQSRADYGDIPNPEDMRKLSQGEERTLAPHIDEVFDFADSIEPEEEMPMAPMETIGQEVPLGQKMGPLEARRGISRTTATTRRTPQQPKERAPAGIMETAKRTFQGGVDYLKSRFS